MSQTDQLLSKTIELQRNTLENSQRAMEQAVELPLQQSVALQRNAAQFMLDGLEIGNWLGTRSVEFTRDALDSYLDTVESAARDTSELTERGIRSAEMAGQRGLDSTQEFATDLADDGQAAAAGGSGGPQGARPPTEGDPSEPQQAPGTGRPVNAGQPSGYVETGQPSGYVETGQPSGYAAGTDQPQQPPTQRPPTQQPQFRQHRYQQQQPQQLPTQRIPPQQSQSQQPQPQRPQSQQPQQPLAAQQLPARQPSIQQLQSRQNGTSGASRQGIPPQQVQPQGEPETGVRTGQSAQAVPTPSRTPGAPAGGETARQPPDRPTPDSQAPPRQTAVVGENEREVETPADNA